MFFKKILLVFLIIFLATVCIPIVSYGAMSSSHYYIYADSVDSGGGWDPGGAYSLSGSVGEGAIGISTSSVYEVRAGYQAMERGNLTLLLNSNSIDLGELSTLSVSSASIVATVNTNSLTGYTLSIGAVSGSGLRSVTDGLVDGAGSTEEYGVAVSGQDRSFSDDRAVENGLILASSLFDANYTATTIIFKAKPNGSTVSGNYNQSVTLNLSANI